MKTSVATQQPTNSCVCTCITCTCIVYIIHMVHLKYSSSLHVQVHICKSIIIQRYSMSLFYCTKYIVANMCDVNLGKFVSPLVGNTKYVYSSVKSAACSHVHTDVLNTVHSIM